MLRMLTMLLLMGALAACGSHGAPDASASAAPAAAATNALAHTPMAAYGRALNRARGVQDIVNAQAAKQAAAIQSASSSH